ncbi:hypothetical protein GCM10010319_64190 [Streptomyces blastmyceticus]|uniref:Uncharacterized protein n=1 Tax=Streptomyces blastmyceticus TaxID=68180 RepID=A0ABP3HQH5_9ACTN
MACPAKLSGPSASGTAPTAKAMGAVTGAVTRSAGLTHSAQAEPATRKKTP